MKSTLLLCLALSTSLWQQRDTLIDVARRNGGAAMLNIDINSPVGDLDHLVTESTAIVRGTVKSVTARLSDDQQIVETEFDIMPIRFYKGTFVGAAARPGLATSLVVQRPGGKLTVEGLKLETNVSEFPEAESLARGDEVVLFLSPDPSKPSRFTLTRGAFGAYRVTKGNVVAMTKSSASRRNDVPKRLDAFEQEVEHVRSK